LFSSLLKSSIPTSLICRTEGLEGSFLNEEPGATILMIVLFCREELGKSMLILIQYFLGVMLGRCYEELKDK